MEGATATATEGPLSEVGIGVGSPYGPSRGFFLGLGFAPLLAGRQAGGMGLGVLGWPVRRRPTAPDEQDGVGDGCLPFVTPVRRATNVSAGPRVRTEVWWHYLGWADTRRLEPIGVCGHGVGL